MLFLVLFAMCSVPYTCAAQTSTCTDIHGGDWTLVRHAYNAWHPATDSLAGTDVYGTYDNDPQSTSNWSIPYSEALEGDGSTVFMFSNGDCSEFLITSNDQFFSSSARIIASHYVSNVYTVTWNSTWISWQSDSHSTLLYGEASNTNHLDRFNVDGADLSVNVWIRNDKYFAAPTSFVGTWKNASDYCKSHDSHLASIHSYKDLQRAVLECASANGKCWVGLNDITAEGMWQWSDNTTTDYGFWNDHRSTPTTGIIPWALDQPNNWGGGQNCVGLIDNGVLGDYKCKAWLRPLCKQIDPFCDRGIRGTYGKNACCAFSCGICGGANCQSRPGGPPGCCTSAITAADQTCDNTIAPCVISQTRNPTTLPPTQNPTKYPTTNDPSVFPTDFPSMYPSVTPTPYPTSYPSIYPTINPSAQPTFDPSALPTPDPTSLPTVDPTLHPVVLPTTREPTFNPTRVPTFNPTRVPTWNPTNNPTIGPTVETNTPSSHPTTGNPTRYPTFSPTPSPTPKPTFCYEAKYQYSMTNGDYLWTNERLVSSNCRCQLAIDTRGNLILSAKANNLDTEFTNGWMTGTKVSDLSGGASVARLEVTETGLFLNEYLYKNVPSLTPILLWSVESESEYLILYLDRKCCLALTDKQSGLEHLIWSVCAEGILTTSSPEETGWNESSPYAEGDDEANTKDKEMVESDPWWVWLLLVIVMVGLVVAFIVWRRVREFEQTEEGWTKPPTTNTGSRRMTKGRLQTEVQMTQKITAWMNNDAPDDADESGESIGLTNDPDDVRSVLKSDSDETNETENTSQLKENDDVVETPINTAYYKEHDHLI